MSNLSVSLRIKAVFTHIRYSTIFVAQVLKNADYERTLYSGTVIYYVEIYKMFITKHWKFVKDIIYVFFTTLS